MANHIRKGVKTIFIVAHVLSYRNVTSLLLCVLTEMDAHQDSSCWPVRLSEGFNLETNDTTFLFPSDFAT